jgi:hypothetical protein
MPESGLEPETHLGGEHEEHDPTGAEEASGVASLGARGRDGPRGDLLSEGVEVLDAAHGDRGQGCQRREESVQNGEVTGMLLDETS